MKELKHLNKYFKKYWLKLFLGIIITVVARLFQLIMPSYVNNSITVVEQYIKAEIEKSTAQELLMEYILIIVGAALLSGFFTFLMRQLIINISRYIEYDLKNEIFDHYQKLSLNFYKKNRTGDLMNRISEDVNEVRMYAGPAIMYGIQTLTLFACLIPLMFIKAPTLAAYTLLPLPILSVLIYQISKVIHKRSTIVQQYLSTLSTFTQEIFSGVSVIKAYALEPQTNNDLVNLAIEGKEKSVSLAKVNAWFFPLMILLIGISNILVIYIGGKQYLAGEIEVGLIAEFILYVNMLTWPVAIVGWLTSIVQRAAASQERINEFLNQESELKNTPTHEHKVKGKIEFKDVDFTYQDTNINALKHLSFTINEGETTAIIGKTGSGKSTILDLVARLYDTTSGEILIDNEPIKSIDLTSLRESIGAVPQDAFLFSDSIKNNIKFGKENATDQEIIDIAKDAVVHENIMGFSKKYDTVLGERGITLSGGQKQRVSIARALIKKPQIYLFDDCLSAVDTETEEEILNNLKKASKNRTTLIVSHRVSSAKNADKILVLDDGRLIQEGTHDELNTQEGYYKDLYHKQLSEKEN
ncbi:MULTISPECIES: ABC transporter ATP-binding protein [Maribacter]|uniref:ATP-binding cassette, subfamily B n=1 Tax=Maribacter stanieri TaxID=440514 RepID=A0A1I6ILL1_9FLAO|nr:MULTISPECIES: ABC transporter ATP-binding protein [Maribacter]SFR67551.1 ATP-binding cassette, subfamily B [Maribacter stanieri]|tara:strand:+ start:1598 stop:3349 length:1752 start_codon:yes stop_codon:yes gene_type:complete|eukprot:TRINITY_DN35_c0_g1_i1.p1 TRINITY_DN35_c0_g1~~TRINITY_DN35_c0_g1_i1.p1  ORF type:complete len:584 (-),score=110.49 TRINITY_DN35_c0_g1_i1:5743-7494(-)